MRRAPPATKPNRQRLLDVRVGDIFVAGAYFPLKKSKVDFWRDEFLPDAERYAAEPAILLGDWNSGQPYLDETGATLYAARELACRLGDGLGPGARRTATAGRVHLVQRPAALQRLSHRPCFPLA